MRRTLLAGPGAKRRISSVLGRVLPDSGVGPAADRLEDWRWSMRVEGATTGEHRIEVDVEADGHPGYLTTAKMIGEAGLILSERSPDPALARLPDPGRRPRHRVGPPLRAGRPQVPGRRLIRPSSRESLRPSGTSGG